MKKNESTTNAVSTRMVLGYALAVILIAVSESNHSYNEYSVMLNDLMLLSGFGIIITISFISVIRILKGFFKADSSKA